MDRIHAIRRNLVGKNKSHLNFALAIYCIPMPGIEPQLSLYVGQGDKPSYTSPYVHAETHPVTATAQTNAGRSAVAGLARRIGVARYLQRPGSAGETGKVLVPSLFDNFIVSKPNQFVGLTIQSPVDLAALVQAYRDPRFEPFHAVFLKEATVAGNADNAITLKNNYNARAVQLGEE